MYAPPVPPKLRLPVLALALSTFLLFCYLRSAEPEDARDWRPPPPQAIATQPQVDTSKGLGGGLLFDHTPPLDFNPAQPAYDPADLPSSINPPFPPNTNPIESSNVPTAHRRKRRAIVTAIWDYSYASMALMLGHTIRQHNDLEALDAELILLTLEPSDEWLTGLTSWNRSVLHERGGWNIRSESLLEVPGVNTTKIQAHRRLNLNKLKIFGWEEYERIVFIDADCIVKGSIEELFKLPAEVEFAAAPDGWPLIEFDARFNSGVMLFTPSQQLFNDMITKLANPRYHDPNEGDQQFLQNYWKFRDYRLPPKFNLNLIHFVWRKRDYWDKVFPDARIVHFTDRKPREWWRGGWCENPVTKPPKIGPNECGHIEVLKWYKGEFEKMRKELKLENEIGILG